MLGWTDEDDLVRTVMNWVMVMLLDRGGRKTDIASEVDGGDDVARQWLVMTLAVAKAL